MGGWAQLLSVLAAVVGAGVAVWACDRFFLPWSGSAGVAADEVIQKYLEKRAARDRSASAASQLGGQQ